MGVGHNRFAPRQHRVLDAQRNRKRGGRLESDVEAKHRARRHVDCKRQPRSTNGPATIRVDNHHVRERVVNQFEGRVGFQQGGPVGYLLFCWGTFAFIGLFLGGMINDKIGAHRAISIALPVMTIALPSLSVSATYFPPSAASLPVLAAVAVWGTAGWGFFPAQQARLIGYRSDPRGLIE